MFRPCIDLHEGKVKQIVGGTLDTGELKTNFVAEQKASYFAELFKKDKLTGGHIIMLGKGNEDEALNALRTYPSGMQIGGGITNLNAEHYLENGATHVIVTSWLFEDNKFSFARLKEINSLIGKKHLVIDLSCRQKGESYFVVTNRWQTFTELQLSEELIYTLEKYCDELLIHAVDVEGKKCGMDISLLSCLSQWGNIVITYAGGARSKDDLFLTEKIGKGRIHLTIGSALDIFGGNEVKYSDAVAFNRSLKK